MSTSKHICVYCSASRDLAPVYHEAAAVLGRLMAKRGDTLVYGGGSYGLMGEVARAVHTSGGRVVGVMPTFLKSEEFLYADADEMIITADMRERKAGMYQRSDAFIALPGGIGTLEEVFEIMTLRSLNISRHPLVLINTCGFFDPLQALLEKMNEERFLRRAVSDIFFLAADPADALAHIDASVEAPTAQVSNDGAQPGAATAPDEIMR